MCTADTGKAVVLFCPAIESSKAQQNIVLQLPYFDRRGAAYGYPNPAVCVSFWKSVYRSTVDGKRARSGCQNKFAAGAKIKIRVPQVGFNYYALHSVMCFLRSG